MTGKLLFVINRIGTMEIFSLPILSAIAKQKGWEVRLAEVAGNMRRVIREAKVFGPDVIAYSVCSNEANLYLDINNKLKQNLSFFSLFGGPHVTYFPSFIENEKVDAVCRGEGDIALGMFLEHFGTEKMQQTPNFIFKNAEDSRIENELLPLVENLDSLPFPDREIIYTKNYFQRKTPIKSFFAGRGCPFQCSYCFNHSFNKLYKGKGKVLREKSVDYLIAEIKSVEHPLTFIKFHDDVFGMNKEWFTEFAEKYPAEVGLPFLCYARPNMVDEEYVRLLKKSGCFSVSIAAEAGDAHIRNVVLRRNMKDEDIENACKLLMDSGIRVYLLSMIGNPGEDEEMMLKTIRLNQKIRPDFADASILQPYIGTDIHAYCLEQDLIDSKIDTFNSQFSDSVIRFDDNLKKRIYYYHRYFSRMVDHPEFLVKLQRRMGRTSFLNSSFSRFYANLFYRFYYGYFLHKRIYKSQIPLYLTFLGGIRILFSRNRT
ncbi:MAG: radical SAM protein [Bacteroidetes bacterium]|nr:radical SAM protein [Bacteroidota bacterium]MBU1719174.1 radical SAM protein [Bacteroidota bacterium]